MQGSFEQTPVTVAKKGVLVAATPPLPRLEVCSLMPPYELLNPLDIPRWALW